MMGNSGDVFVPHLPIKPSDNRINKVIQAAIYWTNEPNAQAKYEWGGLLSWRKRFSQNDSSNILGFAEESTLSSPLSQFSLV